MTSPPVMQAIQTPGSQGIASATSLAASGGLGFFLDCSALYQANVVGLLKTGSASATTSGLTQSFYEVYAETTTSSAISGSGVTSVNVTSTAGMNVGQKIAIGTEIVTISAIAGSTLTISSTQYSHTSGTTVYLITQTAATLGATLGAGTANTTYSSVTYIQFQARLFAYFVNLDATNAVTIESTVTEVTG